MTSVVGPAWRSRGAMQRCGAKPLAVCAARAYATMPSRSRMLREMDKAHRISSAKMNPEQSVSKMQKLANAEYFKNGDGPLFPGTFVSLPLSSCPRKPFEFAQYQWHRMKLWLAGTVSVLNFKLRSMPNWTTRPRWKARRGQIAPTATALYREVLEAFAEGDKTTLHKICQSTFANKLVAAIDRRNPRERVRFQVVKYNKPLWYPRLMSHQIHQSNPLDKSSVTEQAIVAICSTQQASRYNAATNETIPGSLKLQDKIEYVVLSRLASQKTFESGPWRIWGTTSATTLEVCLKEKVAIELEQAKRVGWNQSATR